MIILACVDDKFGLMFNKRRQSQDRILMEHITAIPQKQKLWMNSYSAKMFGDGLISLEIDDNFLDKAGQGDYCFVEDCRLSPYEENIEKIYLYKWNRAYPSDLKFDINLDQGWKLISSIDFPGFSHEKITEEIYIK